MYFLTREYFFIVSPHFANGIIILLIITLVKIFAFERFAFKRRKKNGYTSNDIYPSIYLLNYFL